MLPVISRPTTFGRVPRKLLTIPTASEPQSVIDLSLLKIQLVLFGRRSRVDRCRDQRCTPYCGFTQQYPVTRCRPPSFGIMPHGITLPELQKIQLLTARTVTVKVNKTARVPAYLCSLDLGSNLCEVCASVLEILADHASGFPA